MKEGLKQKDIPASESDLQQAVDRWWDYLDSKMKVRPDITGGIVPRLVDNEVPQEVTRTIKLSLVETIAPELADFGKLVNAKRPHVYVEGTRNNSTVVRFNELSSDNPFNNKKLVFVVDQNNKLHKYLAEKSIQPDRFFLYIYTSNDMDAYGRFYQNITVRELVFFTSKDSKMNAYALKERSVRINDSKHLLGYLVYKALDIKPVTVSQIAIVKESFRNGRLKLG